MRFKFDISRFANLGQRIGLDKPRPPGESFYIYILLFFAAYLAADSLSLYTRSFMLPSGGTKGRPTLAQKTKKPSSRGSYFSIIKDKNIFNSDHIIAVSKIDKENPGAAKEDGQPVETSLPLDLIGTIVHSNSKKSVATIQIKGKREIEPYKVDEKIQSMAKVIKISRQKVVFRNTRTQKLEFIEIKDEAKFKIGLTKPSGGETAAVESTPTNFTFSRSEITKHLENLPQILQDAKAVPYVVPGSGGEVDGFKLVAIKPGSIYEKLGLKRGDIIKGVNGEKVDSPQKAMELYQALKSSNSIEIEISRENSATTLNYNIE